MEKLFKNLLLIVFIIIGITVIGVIFNLTKKAGLNISQKEGEFLSSNEVSEKVINFINQNLLRGATTASLVDILEEKGLYKIKFTIEGQEREIEVYASLDGELFFPEAIDLTELEPVAVETSKTIGNFSVSDDEICKENGKPIVYFFGSEGCGFCRWEHPVVEAVTEKFGEEISFHNNIDSDDDQEVFEKYSTGGIPTLVFGCRYYRVGAGQNDGEEGETKNLTALICKLTGNNPANVCEEVKDLVGRI